MAWEKSADTRIQERRAARARGRKKVERERAAATPKFKSKVLSERHFENYDQHPFDLDDGFYDPYDS